MPTFTFLVQILIYTLLPLLGVLFFGWDWRQIIILFWLENITVGLKTVIGAARSKNVSIDTAPKYGRIAHFVANYGIFTAVHGVFVFAITLGAFFSQTSLQLQTPVDIPTLLIFWAIASMVQIVMTFVQPALTLDLVKQLKEPYKRIIPLHLAIIFGAFVAMTYNLPSGFVIVLIALKLLVDVFSYVSATRRPS